METLLVRGEIWSAREALDPPDEGPWRMPKPSPGGIVYQRLSRLTKELLEFADPGTISALDLSELVDAEPRALVEAIRSGISRAEPESVSTSSGGPRWTAGNRHVVLLWSASDDPVERMLRQAVEMAWGIADQLTPVRRLVIPYVRDGSPALLGQLPPSLAGRRSNALLARRLVTYHALNTGNISERGNSGKQLGRLLLRYRDFGLVVERRYATGEEIAQLGIWGDRATFGRPKLWESVPAAAGQFFGMIR